MIVSSVSSPIHLMKNNRFTCSAAKELLMELVPPQGVREEGDAYCLSACFHKKNRKSKKKKYGMDTNVLGSFSLSVIVLSYK